MPSKTLQNMWSGAGKGDAPRPVNKEKYDENYTRIFGKVNVKDNCLPDDDPLRKELQELREGR